MKKLESTKDVTITKEAEDYYVITLFDEIRIICTLEGLKSWKKEIDKITENYEKNRSEQS